MRKRSAETSEQRTERLMQDARMKKDAAAAEEATVDRMIRRNIEQFGA